MSFLRRWLGGEDASGAATATNGASASTDAEADEAERLHERELMQAENERLDDLRRRQIKYGDRAWTPPAQGGERRAEDTDQPS
jgi:hypothetical protein